MWRTDVCNCRIDAHPGATVLERLVTCVVPLYLCKGPLGKSTDDAPLRILTTRSGLEGFHKLMLLGPQRTFFRNAVAYINRTAAACRLQFGALLVNKCPQKRTTRSACPFVARSKPNPPRVGYFRQISLYNSELKIGLVGALGQHNIRLWSSIPCI